MKLKKSFIFKKISSQSLCFVLRQGPHFVVLEYRFPHPRLPSASIAGMCQHSQLQSLLKFFLFFETGPLYSSGLPTPHCVTQAGFELEAIFQPQVSKCWDYWNVLPCLIQIPLLIFYILILQEWITNSFQQLKNNSDKQLLTYQQCWDEPIITLL